MTIRKGASQAMGQRLCSWLTLALAARAHGQESKPPPILTDRPTFSDSSSLSGTGWWQFESGSTYTHLPTNSLTTLGELTIRRQVSPNLELRLVNLGFAFEQNGGPGLEDPEVGFKYRFLTGTSRRPELTFEGLSSVPVGAPTFRTNAFQPTAKLAWTQGINSVWTAAGNFIYARPGSGNAAFDQWAASVFLTQALNGATSLFYEVYGLSSEGPGAAFGDAGVLYLLSSNCQLDARVGSGFDERRDGWFVGAGVSWRF